MAKILEFQLQHHPFQRNPRAELLQNGLVGSPCSPRTLKNLLQHHSSKASILQCSVFFTVQLSHPHMTTGKTIALTRWTFVGKVTSLFFNMLSRYREKENLVHCGCCYYSVTQSCSILCDPMECSTPVFPVLHYLLEFVQIHVH